MTSLSSELVVKSKVALPKSGINFVCSDCGVLLCHIGIDGTYRIRDGSLPSRHRFDIATRLENCPECGRKLDLEPDPDSVKVAVSDSGKN